MSWYFQCHLPTAANKLSSHTHHKSTNVPYLPSHQLFVATGKSLPAQRITQNPILILNIVYHTYGLYSILKNHVLTLLVMNHFPKYQDIGRDDELVF